jgi:predicted HTH transcriptional regulator
MAEQIGLTKDGIYYQIKKLKAKGVLNRVGSTKTGRWVVLINL